MNLIEKQVAQQPIKPKNKIQNQKAIPKTNAPSNKNSIVPEIENQQDVNDSTIQKAGHKIESPGLERKSKSVRYDLYINPRLTTSLK